MKKQVLLLAVFVFVQGSIYGSAVGSAFRTVMRRVSGFSMPPKIIIPKPPVSNMGRHARTAAKVVGGLFIANTACNLGVISIVGIENFKLVSNLPFNEQFYSIIALAYIEMILNKESITDFNIKHEKVKAFFSQYDKNSAELQKSFRVAIQIMYSLKKDRFSWIDKKTFILEKMIAQELGFYLETLIENKRDGNN